LDGGFGLTSLSTRSHQGLISSVIDTEKTVDGDEATRVHLTLLLEDGVHLARPGHGVVDEDESEGNEAETDEEDGAESTRDTEEVSEGVGV